MHQSPSWHPLKPYTVLITRTGRAPITIRIHPLPVLILLVAGLISPILWLGNTIHTLHRQNSDLVQENDALTESAVEVLEEIETLDADIEDLRKRAGLPEEYEQPSQNRRVNSRGGPQVKVDGEQLLDVAKNRLPQLSSSFNQQVKPALEKTLDDEAARQAARPKGVPLTESIQISSKFGLRKNPFGGGYELHEGVDFAGPYGTPIYATAPGIVKKAEASGGYGNHVVIDHGYGYETLYAHLSEIEVSPKTAVQEGDLIGYLGSSGRSSGPHLHYSVHRRGKAVDPKSYLGLSNIYWESAE